MKSCAVWIVGASGLLGGRLRALARATPGITLYVLERPLPWNDLSSLASSMQSEAARFGAWAARFDEWLIFWAAGAGSFGAAAEAMEPELLATEVLLDECALCEGLKSRPGRIGLASSAGALYSECRDEPVTEDSEALPTTPYGLAKLKQEKMLSSFCATNRHVVGLAARISTIYGPHRSQNSERGLVANMARSIVRRQPLEVYVPFDTIRDYVYVDDAAQALWSRLRRVPPDAGYGIKIVASERPASISEIIAVFRRASRRPLVVNRVNRLSALYNRRITFRSVVEPRDGVGATTSLSVGIFQVLEAERLFIAQGAARK